jgi:hypothetical protein
MRDRLRRIFTGRLLGDRSGFSARNASLKTDILNLFL